MELKSEVTPSLVCRNFRLVRCHLTLKNGSFLGFHFPTLEAILSTQLTLFRGGVGYTL